MGSIVEFSDYLFGWQLPVTSHHSSDVWFQKSSRWMVSNETLEMLLVTSQCYVILIDTFCTVYA